MFSCWQTRIWRVNDWQTCTGNCQPIKTCALFIRFICVTLYKKADASQHLNLPKRLTIVRLCRTFHLLPRETLKTNKRKWRNQRTNWLRPNLSISPPLSVSSRLFFCLTVLYVSANTLNKSGMLQIWREFDVWRNEFGNFLKFANVSLPT